MNCTRDSLHHLDQGQGSTEPELRVRPHRARLRPSSGTVLSLQDPLGIFSLHSFCVSEKPCVNAITLQKHGAVTV